MQAYIFAFIAVFGYAITQVIARKIQLDWSVSPLLFIVISMSVLLPLSILTLYLTEKPNFSQISFDSWLLMIVCWIINLFAFILLVWALKNIPVAHYQIIAILTPLIWWIVAYIWYGEKLWINFFIWYSIVVLWVFITIYKKTIF